MAPLVSFKLLQRKRCTKPLVVKGNHLPEAPLQAVEESFQRAIYKSIISSSSTFLLSGSILPHQLQWASGETNTTEVKLEVKLFFFASFLLPVSFSFFFFLFVTAKLVSIGSSCFCSIWDSNPQNNLIFIKSNHSKYKLIYINAEKQNVTAELPCGCNLCSTSLPDQHTTHLKISINHSIKLEFPEEPIFLPHGSTSYFETISDRYPFLLLLEENRPAMSLD